LLTPFSSEVVAMLFVRWNFCARFGKIDDCIAVLKKWQIDVGQRVGWKVGSIRVARAVFGNSDTRLEIESRCEDLSELEETWADLEHSPLHREYVAMLEPLVVPGTNEWRVWREISLAPKD